MSTKINATKLSMTQIFEDDGVVVPVTSVLLSENSEFEQGEIVNVIGTSKGKGFAGVIKRHSFSGGPRSHGQKDKHRSPGSIGGGTDPGKVWKGKKMPGRMGGKRVTVQGLAVIRIIEKNNRKEIFLKGAVPGHRGSKLTIVKTRQDEG